MNLNQLFKTLSDESRIRLMLLLNQQELTVAELSEITELAQPRVSTHLSHLRKNNAVIARKQGVSSFYRLNQDLLTGEFSEIFKTLTEHYQQHPLIEQDNRQLADVLSKNAKSNKWVDSVAGDMERHYSPGRTWEATTRVIARMTQLGRVLDIGSGDGVLAELMAQQSTKYTCVDNNSKAIDAAKSRLSKYNNIDFHICDMHQLPFSDDHFDWVLLLHVLTYAQDPKQVLNEAHRVCKPGGRLMVSTLFKHGYESVKEQYGHINLGFDTKQLIQACQDVGFDEVKATITSQEQRKPHFKIITLEAMK